MHTGINAQPRQRDSPGTRVSPHKSQGRRQSHASGPGPPPDRRERRKQDYATEPAQPAPTGAHRCPRIASGQRHTGRSFLKGTYPTTSVITSHKRAEGILSPPIPQMNPINPHKQKKQNRVIEPARIGADRRPPLPPGTQQGSGKKRTFQRRLDIPDHVNDHLGLKGRRHSFTPAPPNEPHEPPRQKNQKNQNTLWKDLELRTQCARLPAVRRCRRKRKGNPDVSGRPRLLKMTPDARNALTTPHNIPPDSGAPIWTRS